MPPKPSDNLYLSSTLADLKKHRDKVRDVLARYFTIRDSYSADSQRLVASCLEDVRGSSLYVGIFAFRYGDIPTGPDNPDKLSITELEYRHARANDIPCLIFLLDPKASWPVDSVDASRDRIDRLRKDLSSDARAAFFTSEDDLALKVSNGVKDHFARAQRASAPSMDPEAQVPHPRQLSKAMLLLYLEGTDDAAASLLQRALRDGKREVKLQPISPEDPPSLARVDAAFSECRSACILMTRASLPRLQQMAATVQSWIRLIHTQTGRPCVLITDGTEVTSGLGEEWTRLPAFDVGALLRANTETLAGELSTFIVEMKKLHPDFDRPGLVGLSYSVLAMTKEEATPFADAKPGPEYVRRVLEGFAKAEWAERYGVDRLAFSPFKNKTIREIVQSVVRDINEQQVVPRRDRENLRGNQIRLRYYPFDPALAVDEDLRRLYAQMKRRGCLVVADELSLCEPSIRRAAKTFFDDRAISVVALAARDPMVVPFDTAVEEIMDVGDLLGRFRDRLDLRCELAVASRTDLRRWLRYSVPETLGVSDLDAADPDLRLAFRTEASS